MTATLQRETLPLQREQVHDSALAIADSVGARLDCLTSLDTNLHDFFYGENGITAVPLSTMSYPYAEHLWLQDETDHRDKTFYGEDIAVPTFKIRGARAAGYAALLKNPGLRVFSTASAGNHGQGVAAAANELGVDAEIHVTSFASEVKKDKMRALGAQVIDHYPTLAQAMAGAQNDTSPWKAFIHPFNNLDVIAGQATVGTEMLQSLYAKAKLGMLDLHHDEVTLFAPVGGGGLATGIAIAIKQAKDSGRIGANFHVVPVQIEHKESNEWCDGTMTRTGNMASVVLSDRRFAEETLVVSETWVAEAMVTLGWELKKTVEPAGALALAGALWAGYSSGSNHYTGNAGHFVVPITGASVTADSFARAAMLRHDAQKADVALPSLTSRYVYDCSSASTEVASTQVGNHSSGLLNQNLYGPYSR
jgi:threonine dehydratase